MTVEDALEIRSKYIDRDNLTDDEEFIFTEALDFLITKTGDDKYMCDLGGYYYLIGQFDLALKYYEMADALGNLAATDGLAYIWYYGRTGVKDYKKAFECYSKLADLGSPFARYKVADMYKNGYYVEKDYDKYVSIIEGLYEEYRDNQYTNSAVPEIYTRLAGIRKRQGKTDERIRLYLYAKDFLRQRLQYDTFWGNLSIMNMLVNDLYTMKEFDADELDLFDLFYLLKNPAEVSFMCGKRQYFVKSCKIDGEMAVCFGGKWYHSVMEFFNGRIVYGKKLCAKNADCWNFVIQGEYTDD